MDNGSPGKMQPFVVQALRSIAGKLTALGSAEVDAPAEEEPRQPLMPPEYNLDVRMAEAVGAGTYVFPDPRDDATDWCVFALYALDQTTGANIFRFVGRLVSTMNSEEFVLGAYEFILGRRIDADGLRIYPPLLESLQLCRREVLRILADSDEARRNGNRFILVPDPSSWLDNIGTPRSDDDSLPPLSVKAAG